MLPPQTGRHGRVLHVIDTTGPGGAETVFLELASGLRDRGWQPYTVVVGPGWVLDNVCARDLPVEIVHTEGRLDHGFLRRLWELVRRWDIDVIQAHLLSPAIYASVVGLLSRVPVVATLHGNSDTEDGGLGRRFRFKLVQRQSTVVCVSDALSRKLLENGLVKPRHLRIIHNGVDPTRFEAADGSRVRREHGISDDTVLVGALGNVRPAKDYFTLLRAAAKLSDDRRYAFAVVGERTEPLHSDLVTLRDSLGLEERFSFWGFREDVPEVLAAFDVLAISSSNEGFSLAAIQAMAAGTPVVATRSGGPEDIITHELDGLLIPVGAPILLASAISRMSRDGALRDSLRTEGRRTVGRRFSAKAMLDRYTELYTEICDGGVEVGAGGSHS